MYTIDSLKDLPEEQLELIGFALHGKIAWMAIPLAFRIARNQGAENAEKTIDGYNDRMARLEELEANSEFFANAGLGSNVSDRESLAMWLGVRQVLTDRGVKAQPFSENFRFLVERASTKFNENKDRLEGLAEALGMPTEVVKKIAATKNQRNAEDTLRDCEAAMEVIVETTPDTERTPEELNRIIHEAIDASRKSAVIRADSVEDAMANAIFLKALAEEEGVPATVTH